MGPFSTLSNGVGEKVGPKCPDLSRNATFVLLVISGLIGSSECMTA